MNRIERIRGCLLGGAAGDSLGCAVDFLEWPVIEARFGAHGIIDFSPAYGMTGAVSDSTQMMLFTAEGLLRAYVLEPHDWRIMYPALSTTRCCAG
ncbi:ADP-ribosylglycohydrolase family protein [Pseudomonas sp. zbq_4]|uniref:ADP-ribosylglycohydrolase family protein n=1 Tax=Pseudomonas sp. zbq_4 TaxID=3367240 RepID=UPI003709D94B